jgi:hypothetical protein
LDRKSRQHFDSMGPKRLRRRQWQLLRLERQRQLLAVHWDKRSYGRD